MPTHHPFILAAPRPEMVYEPGFYPDVLLPIRIRRAFEQGMHPISGASPAVRTRPPLPPFDAEYFEWIALLESLSGARDRFVMAEIGAGYGRWLVRGVWLAQERGLACEGVAVEPEPDHFRFLVQHLRDNGIDPKAHALYWAAVTVTGGVTPFLAGRADAWYGQAIPMKRHALEPLPVAARLRLKARAYLGRPIAAEGACWVPGVTLSEVLGDYARVDFVHVDIQRAEDAVLRAELRMLTARTRRICIGTHSDRIEHHLRKAFSRDGWECLHDYPGRAESDTPFGRIGFEDGLQVWRNPALDR